MIEAKAKILRICDHRACQKNISTDWPSKNFYTIRVFINLALYLCVEKKNKMPSVKPRPGLAHGVQTKLRSINLGLSARLTLIRPTPWQQSPQLSSQTPSHFLAEHSRKRRRWCIDFYTSLTVTRRPCLSVSQRHLLRYQYPILNYRSRGSHVL